ncbi:MAG TPA: DUF2934 domain-containing protein [Blastocatellia bacterium]|nr:DUF2934 domain-containing protein [Blastocatellia bacterium]
MSRESLEELRGRLLRDEHAQELIRMRAFEIYKLRGGQPGGEAHDWFQAESEVLTFLIEEESQRTARSETADAGTKSASSPSNAAAAPSTKPAVRRTTGARKTKEASAKKKAPTRPASKKSSDSPAKSPGRQKKD